MNTSAFTVASVWTILRKEYFVSGAIQVTLKTGTNMTYFANDETDAASQMGHVIGDALAALVYLSVAILMISVLLR